MWHLGFLYIGNIGRKESVMTKECNWPECGRNAISRGFCSRCYQRAKREDNWKDPWEYWEPPIGRDAECKWPECREKNHTLGYCKSHYDRARYIDNFTDPWNDSVPPSWYGLTECSWPGCGDIPKARGFCAKHYCRAQQVESFDSPWDVWESQNRPEKSTYYGWSGKNCRWPGCLIRDINGHGMCVKHHSRAKRIGVFDSPWEVWGHGVCIECGHKIVSDTQQSPRTCSKLCRDRHYRASNPDAVRASSEKRRAAKNGVHISDVDLQWLRETTEDCYL